MILIKNISKSFAEERVLHNVSLEVPDSRTIALIGPSGCGKSTFLRIVMGLLQPDSGSVIIKGREMDSASKSELRKNIGYVIQQGGLFPHLTARGNCSLAAEYFGWSKQKISKRMEKLAELTSIKPALLDKYPGQLSGGQRQRISLMRALMLDPGLILLDEPLGSIDPLVRHELQQDLKSIFSELSKTVLLVTHDLGEAAFLGDEIVLMQAGNIIQKGTIRDLKDEPASDFVKQFVTAQRSPLEEM